MMSALTAVLYGALLVYGAGWWLGYWIGNFSLLLFVLTVVTLLCWLAERYRFAPARAAAAEALVAQDSQRRAELSKQGISQVDSNVSAAREKLLMQPWWLDWTAGLFPVILVVFLLRSFLFEPFKIPSGAMMPTLLTGDLILVNKFTYGLRLPVINTKITDGRAPARGDVMVFRYPPKPSLDYIKRVVGLPGDEVAYLNKKLTINGQPVNKDAIPDYFDEETMRYLKQYTEKLGDRTHKLLNDDSRRAGISEVEVMGFPNQENCRYSVEGVVCKVPAGHYFMMGDNRDNSLDSRYWGFVPDKNIVGRAFFVWMNFGNLGRIGAFQ